MNFFNFIIILSMLIASKTHLCNAIWCYRCTSATPGCAEDFNWRGIGYWGEQCPEDDDLCVKIIEIKGATTQITRDCFSGIKDFRTDIPADRYEGCKPAAKDVKLAHYVFNNTIKELDIRRDYFDSTTFCYCFLDHRCNDGSKFTLSVKLMVISAFTVILLQRLVV